MAGSPVHMEPQFSPEMIVKVTEGRQLSTTLAGEVVILDIERGLYYGLDGVGVDVWTRLQSPSRLGDLVDHVVDHYDVDRPTAHADIQSLLRELFALGLIERDGPAKP